MWAQIIVNFPVMQVLRSEEIGGKAAVSANWVYNFTILSSCSSS